MPLKRTEGTQACSGVSTFDSRAHWTDVSDLKIKGPDGFFDLKVKPGKKYVINF
jgi:hypothetical protein